MTTRLRSAEALRNGRIHPVDVFLALRVYLSGRSQPDRRAERRTWTPAAEISDALEEAYELSFGHVRPSGKRMLVAVDSSGSMSGAWGRNQLTLGEKAKHVGKRKIHRFSSYMGSVPLCRR